MITQVAITSRIVLPVPPEQAWRAVVDWPRQGQWMLATRVRGGHGAGAQVVAKTGIGPLGFTDTMVITHWEPPRRCVVAHTGRVIRGAGVFEVVPAGAGSELRWTERLELPFATAGRWGWRVVRPLVQREMDRSLRRFARLAGSAGSAERPAGICHDGRVESPSEVRVRPARLADQAELTELEAIAWSPESGFPSVMAPGQRDATFFDAGNPPEAFLVAELNGRVAGYIRLKPPTKLPENAHVVQVQGLAVHPDARRRGVAVSLLDAAEETLRERGTRKLTLRVLSTNEAAIRLYERHGFVREGTLREEFCINGRFVDDVMMAKNL